MAKTKQTDVLARLADAGEEVLSRLVFLLQGWTASPAP